METTCEICDKPCNSKRFCSMACYSEYKRRNQIELICDFCGKRKLVSAKRATTNRHCSRKCYLDSLRVPTVRTCKDCGQEKPIEEFSHHTRGKDLRRAYCKECERQRMRTRSKTVRARWLHSRLAAQRNKRRWEISPELFALLISQPCHYCGSALNNTGSGLDRKDNQLGYVPENVVPCCRQCNVVKNSFFSYDEMMQLSSVLKNIMEKKSNANRA